MMESELKRWSRARLLIVAGASIAVALTVTLWVFRGSSSTRPGDDCATVVDLGSQWSAMVASAKIANEKAINDSDNNVLLGVAESASELGRKLHAAADTASDPKSKQALVTWSDAAEGSAQLQRDVIANPQTPGDQIVARTQKNISLLDQATEPLAQKCPDLTAALAPSKE